MQNQIKPCLWFDNNAEEAAGFYTSVFNDSTIESTSRYSKEGFELHGMKEGTLLTAEIQLFGQKFVLLNGGPAFKPNPSISFFVICDSAKEVDMYWEKLKQDGNVLMPLDKYDWSERYGWVQDRFGINWQLFYGAFDYGKQKIVPALMFTKEKAGKAEDAISFYTSIFKNSSVKSLHKYSTEDQDVEGRVKHAQFNLGNTVFAAMDSSISHDFTFNEAISLMVICENQEEIDYYWGKLTDGGEESMCGWLKDKFGVSWQIVPEILNKLMTNPEKAGKVTQAFMKMKKFDIEQLEKA